MKRFIGLSTTFTPNFLKYYALSLGFSAKHMPTLVDFPNVFLKTEKYQIYQGINYVLQDTSCSLVLLDRLLGAKFVTSRQNFDTPGNSGGTHEFASSAKTLIDLVAFGLMQSSYRRQQPPLKRVACFDPERSLISHRGHRVSEFFGLNP
jgi:hypothetical protein